jgi:hypothetical protein
VQLTATCNFGDGTTENCTSQATWTSGNSGIAHVSDFTPTKGLVTSVNVGNTAISATLGAIQGSVTTTVTGVPLTSNTITAPNPSISPKINEPFASVVRNRC